MKILRVSEEKNGFKLRFGKVSPRRSKSIPFEMLITTVKIEAGEELELALKLGAEVAEANFAAMQKFNEQ